MNYLQAITYVYIFNDVAIRISICAENSPDESRFRHTMSDVDHKGKEVYFDYFDKIPQKTSENTNRV